MVFKLSYLEKTYIKSLLGKLTASNSNCVQRCFGKISNRRVVKMSMSDLLKASFKDIFWTGFLISKQKLKLFTLIYLFFGSYLNVAFLSLVLTLSQRYVSDVITPTNN